MYKVEPETLASGVHGFSEIVHLVLNVHFWRTGETPLSLDSQMDMWPKETQNILTLLILKTTLGRR